MHEEGKRFRKRIEEKDREMVHMTQIIDMAIMKRVMYVSL